MPPPKLKSQSKKKRRASRLLSVESARSRRHVRLAEVVSESVSQPPFLRDGDNYEPPVITASRTLENR